MAQPILENPAVLTGCDAIVKLNGVALGYLKSIELNENVNQSPVEAIGFWKPRGFKSTRWSGDASAEFHILTTRGDEGVPTIDTSSPVAASAPYFFEFFEKSSGQRIANAIGHINTRGFSVLTNELSGQRIAFVLRDITYQEAYN